MSRNFFACCILFAGAAVQAVTVETYGPFDIYYYDVGEIAGGYTNVQAWSALQQADIRSAIDEWDRVILNTPARQIKMHVGWLALDVNVLGTSASQFNNLGTQTLFSGSELAWREGDATETDWDTFILYDVDAAGREWNFGADTPSASAIDFRTTITHEIGHSLGWGSSYYAPLDAFGQVSAGGLTTYDRFLVDGNGNRAVVGGTGFNEVDAPVYFDGYSATNLYGGLVPIYAPDPYESGSSLSHLDETTFAATLMTPIMRTGDSTRTISDLEIAMMADMGWAVIPEPASLVMMLVFAAGFIGVRRIFRI